MRRTTIGTAVMVAVCVLGLGACGSKSDSATPAGSTGGASAPAAAAGGDGVKWADQVCGSLVSLATLEGKAPKVDEAADPKQNKTEIAKYLVDASTTLGSGSSTLKGAGKAPAPEGDDVVKKLVSFLDDTKKALDTAKADVDSADPANPEQFTKAMTEAVTAMQKVGNGPSFGDLKSKTLDDVTSKAPNCKKISG
ncbi:hypothetical protein F0L68_24915 [Solihabitans fulvus]|uniref:Small secreted protein n=1 Tax=Solihabitans fulvus TaxID=1892852 RepID=A0A5B2X2X0_9PSEU|nr:hypothetical protein [Solihabitans fulvus]KAA2257543.1 hypothetical protein F0L68_24915 [Solihabitans fulvus]